MFWQAVVTPPSKNDTTLYVKGSGTQLATIKAEGFVKMDRARLNEIMKTEYPGNDVRT